MACTLTVFKEPWATISALCFLGSISSRVNPCHPSLPRSTSSIPRCSNVRSDEGVYLPTLSPVRFWTSSR
ncbi:hypothetical protein PF008_g30303 [Phytophthora fragariae]|uniref:Uncharacterized protein n=1 Tax=Phytophthora fragariae TaxID=53985 RepID=A0A6G0Q619_9STRA|nr:hypothetical protein PF008_g30303 [Phytophthora fragariae]